MYGTQTENSLAYNACVFENDVKMYGTQTIFTTSCQKLPFENDVKMYGTQTYFGLKKYCLGLRMM